MSVDASEFQHPHGVDTTPAENPQAETNVRERSLARSKLEPYRRASLSRTRRSRRRSSIPAIPPPTSSIVLGSGTTASIAVKLTLSIAKSKPGTPLLRTVAPVMPLNGSVSVSGVLNAGAESEDAAAHGVRPAYTLPSRCS